MIEPDEVHRDGCTVTAIWWGKPERPLKWFEEPGAHGGGTLSYEASVDGPTISTWTWD